LLFVATGAASLMLLCNPSEAKTKVQGNVVPQNIGGTCGGGGTDPCYNLPTDKFGKFAVKESNAAGGGGIVLQLKVKGVDCPEVDVGGDPDKCNDTAHVLELNTDFNGLVTAVGILYDLDGGKSAFQASGKNKVTGAEVFGALAGAIQGQPLGIGFVRARGPGSNPADCLSAPLLPGNGCNDGERYGIGGVMSNNVTQDCSAGLCVSETCTQDSDCDEFTGPGSTVACNEVEGTCCLDTLDTDPNCDID
jgi:hypothetical protein